MAQDNTAKKRAGRATDAIYETDRKIQGPSAKGVNPGDRRTARPIKDATASPGAKTMSKATTKKETVLGLLSRKSGASIEEMSAATRWQAHSVRGFLSGTVRKKLGLKLASSTSASGTRRYAIKR